MLFLLCLTPAQMQTVEAQVFPPIYNLYATDGYYELPDGRALYNYGFVGGREGVDFWYQPSCNNVKGFCAAPAPGNVLVSGGPVAPQAGPWVGQDAQFAGNAQFPAPIMHSAVGEPVEIRLKNLGVSAQPGAPNDPHSIHLHGLDVDAANDGVPETSLGAVPANLCADGTTDPMGQCLGVGLAPGAGNVIVYMYTGQHEGTYMYHCHQEADIHVQMGMFGALVVYNSGEAGAQLGPGHPGSLYGVNYDKDYIMLVSEFDVRGHQDEEGTYKANSWDPKPYNWALYRPQYWSINGLSFPQTIHASFLSGYTYDQWIQAHPGYETLYTGSITGSQAGWGSAGQKVLLRVINMGFETHPLHMHGYHGKVIGSDARAWYWGIDTATPDRGLEKNTLVIGSGETYDWVVDFGLQHFASTYPTTTESRYDPASNLPVSNTADPAVFPPIPEAGDPLLPDYIAGPTVAGLVNLVGAGDGVSPIDPTVPGFQPAQSQYFPFHNHDDYKATNNGIYPGGMFTFLVPTQGAGARSAGP
jgi:FtsP/CotA-like multicopper oxidase with cupredoxin domain